MGHIANAKEEVYMALAERLSKNPMVTSVTEEMIAILYRLYTESEAMVGSRFPIAPMMLDKIAEITNMKEEELKRILDGMADKGLVLDLPRREGTYYLLAPSVFAFFGFAFARVGDGRTVKKITELFIKNMQNPEVIKDFMMDTKTFKTLVYEKVIPYAVETEVMPYEKASEIIRQSGGGAISLCACMHRASHLGKSCKINAPMEKCMSLGEFGQWCARRGGGKPATVDEMLQLLDQTEKLGLVHQVDNVLNQPVFMCHCCSCCCEVFGASRQSGVLGTHPSNFIPSIDLNRCKGCGECTKKCPMNAISMSSVGNGKEAPELNEQMCIGCGLCATACPNSARTMLRRSVLHISPETKTEQLLRIAREKGKDIKLTSDDFLF